MERVITKKSMRDADDDLAYWQSRPVAERIDPRNGAAMVDALRDVGFGSLAIAPGDVTQPDVIVQLGRPPNRIDLITTPDGVDLGECWASD